MKKVLIALLFIISNVVSAQYILKGHIFESQSLKTVPFANVVVNKNLYTISKEDGSFSLTLPEKQVYTLTISSISFQNKKVKVRISKPITKLDINLSKSTNVLDEFVLTESGSRNKLEKISITRLKAIEGTTINAGKKNEVIQLSKSTFNTATNNSRQIYAEVPGLNIWESDQTGLQLEIGARGLSPQRTSNFNTRQNFYDIAADALGYPESYYTPPSEAVDKIQLIRGAASLQYGPQFGGMLNFVMKKGNENKPFEALIRQSYGSYNLSSTFFSVGGQVKKTNYYAFGQYKYSEGWRPNSKLNSYTLYAGLEHKFSDKTKLNLEYTRLKYTAKQPGGLTQQQFETDPSQSNRSGNWFQVNWNVFALRFQHKLSTNTELSSQFFGLYAQRNALGYLNDISAPEDKLEELFNRDLILSTFQNFGNETKLLHRYKLKKNISALLVGSRYYQGFTEKDQGFGPKGRDADFSFNNRNEEAGTFYEFPSQNLALFVENIFQINALWNITPGVRFEYIKTDAQGFSQAISNNQVIQFSNSKNLNRNVLLYGLGSSYKLSEYIESYANISKNYRAVNFNDLYTINTNIQIDSNLSDESGYNVDIGLRGQIKSLITFDLSVYYLKYSNRIGQVLRVRTAQEENPFTSYQFKTNISDSRTFGFETFVSANLTDIFNLKEKYNLRWFSNVTVQDGRYVDSQESSIKDKKVELVPNFTLKTGLIFKTGKFSGSLMYSYVGEQFSDAENSIQSAQHALYGLIPDYQVLDLSIKQTFKNDWTLGTGLNNILNSAYFTRRASGYPGPGIIPSTNRNFYITLEKKF